MFFFRAALIVLSTLLLAGGAYGTDKRAAELEISYLLEVIGHSDCRFIRNGKTYTAEKAHEHIKTKYEYAKSRVDTAEQFIEYAASRSSITGADYFVRCQDDTILSREWLELKLRDYRATSSATQLAQKTGQMK